MISYIHALPGLILMACATPGEEGKDMITPEPPVSCTTSSTTVFEPAGRIVRGLGTVTCETPATLSLKVCLYSKSVKQTSWGQPLQCMSIAASARTTLSTEVAITLAPGAARMYRTVVSAQVDSVDQPPRESTPITAP